MDLFVHGELAAFVIFQNFVDHVPGPVGYDGISLQIIGESYQCN